MEEVEEVVENLMHNEIDFLDLSFEFAQQAPFTALLYHRRLPDFSDAEFDTLLTVLMAALEANHSVRRVHVDWSFLRLLKPAEQQVLWHRLGSLTRLRSVAIAGTTAHSAQPVVSVYGLLRLFLAQSSSAAVLEQFTMDAMGSLKLQDWTYVEHLSAALVSASHRLQVLTLENLVLPQMPSSTAVPVLDGLVDALITSCTALQRVHVAVSVPRQYRRIPHPLVRADTLARWTTTTTLHTIRLHNWGLQAAHALALLRLPQLVHLDVWNNPLTTQPAEQDMDRYRDILCHSRQQMNLQEFRGMDDDDAMAKFLWLNRCGRGTAGHSPTHTVHYWAAISGTAQLRGTALLDALYTAIREQPSHVPTTCRR